jgi:hypothetical protein
MSGILGRNTELQQCIVFSAYLLVISNPPIVRMTAKWLAAEYGVMQLYK